MGVMAAFNMTINRDALPLSPGPEIPAFFQECYEILALRV